MDAVGRDANGGSMRSTTARPIRGRPKSGIFRNNRFPYWVSLG